LIDYLDPKLINTRFNSLLACGYCTIVAGADQGQGAWRSWMKISTYGGNEVREHLDVDSNFDVKTTYLIAQVAHISCKKDNHEILSSSVSKPISDGYYTLINYQLCFIKVPQEGAKVEAVYLPKVAQDIKVEANKEDPTKCNLVYSLHSGNENGFTTICSYEKLFDKGSTIVLTIPSFNVFITGDLCLCFYADVLGMPNSSSYWCPWCLVSHKEWQGQPETYNTEKRTCEFLNDTYAAIKNDCNKRLKPTDKKGVSKEMHYKSIVPEKFLPPLLHMEMGLVNQIWYAFEDWIDKFVEIIPPHEKEARRELIIAKDKLKELQTEKAEIEKMVNVDV
jgi:hypothetical protein